MGIIENTDKKKGEEEDKRVENRLKLTCKLNDKQMHKRIKEIDLFSFGFARILTRIYQYCLKVSPRLHPINKSLRL